jgi:hypothetical protein|tara:strand:+ start:37 stop:426 length:390 start_codon:yes stop_codon:yes gene_type:complete
MTAVEFPTLKPTARTFESGDFPVKVYKAQNGSEHRILYGSRRTNMRLSLTFANITDAEAEQILDHYDQVQGTFGTVILQMKDAKAGWAGNKDALGAGAHGNSFRYENPPQLTSVRPGVSTVTVNFIGVI